MNEEKKLFRKYKSRGYLLDHIKKPFWSFESDKIEIEYNEIKLGKKQVKLIIKDHLLNEFFENIITIEELKKRLELLKNYEFKS